MLLSSQPGITKLADKEDLPGVLFVQRDSLENRLGGCYYETWLYIVEYNEGSNFERRLGIRHGRK